MEKYRLLRTGNRPLVFMGAVVANISGRHDGGHDSIRYHDLTLYKTESGKWVLHDEYISRMQGEACTKHAWVFSSFKGMLDYLYDTCEFGEMHRELFERAVKDHPELDADFAELI